MHPQQAQGIIKSIRRNVTARASTALEPSTPSSPTGAHGSQQAWPEERALSSLDGKTELEARFAQMEARFDARFDQLQAYLDQRKQCCCTLS
jgi:hypothetical protein